MKSFNAFSATLFAALVLGGAAAPGCAQTDDMTIGETAESIKAGPEAQSRFGVEQYLVRTNPSADGNHVNVGLIGKGGADLGELMAYRDAGDMILRLTEGDTITEIRTSADAMTVLRNGVVRYTLDRSRVSAASGISQLESSVDAVPADVAKALGLASTVVMDQVLIDYVSSVSPNGVPYLITDCPWWVTAAACLGWETGVGGIMCAACGLSYLL